MNISRRNLLAGMGTLPLAAGLATSASAATHEVAIQGFAFVPANLSIAVGDTVRFTNADNAPHTATSASAGLDTGRLGRGDSAELTFDTAGTFNYLCRFHPAMTGAITVG